MEIILYHLIFMMKNRNIRNINLFFSNEDKISIESVKLILEGFQNLVMKFKDLQYKDLFYLKYQKNLEELSSYYTPYHLITPRNKQVTPKTLNQIALGIT